MAYYHRRVVLNRFERFELSTDLKASQKKTSTTEKKQLSTDYGSGIAAQFGLIKKVSDDKCKKISDEVSLKRKKDVRQEKKRITISKQNSHDKINRKRLKKLSADEKIGTSGDESSSQDEDSSPPNTKHGKLKQVREIKKQDKNIHSKLSRNLSIDDKIGASRDQSSSPDEDFSPPTKPRKSREDKEVKLDKIKRKSLPKEINLHERMSNTNHVRNESSGNIDHHISKGKECMRINVIASQEIKRSTGNAYTAKRRKNSEVEHPERKSRNKYSDSNSSENSDNEVKRSIKRRCLGSDHLRQENLTSTNNLLRKSGNAYDETIKKKNRECTGKQSFNDGDRKSISASTPKKKNEIRKEKHKTFTIPKVNKVTPLDCKGSSTNIGEINEKVAISKGTNIPLKEKIKCPHSTASDDNDEYMKRKKKVCESIEDFIKKESIEEEYVVGIPYSSRTDQGENIQNQSNSSKMHIYSAENEIRNVKSSKPRASVKSNHRTENDSAKIDDRQYSEQKNKLNLNIVADTNYSKASKPLPNVLKVRHVSIATQTDLSPSHFTDILAHAEVERENQTIINITFEHGKYFSKSSTKLKNCKGEDLTPWFNLVCDGLRPKHSKTDNSNLNYFITLHSRFMVMESMEMNDLEVLPEDESEEGIGSEPIRIFTNLSKDHYKQYLDESCLNSIPELIVTRLYKI